jgi:hypothetical protein
MAGQLPAEGVPYLAAEMNYCPGQYEQDKQEDSDIVCHVVELLYSLLCVVPIILGKS